MNGQSQFHYDESLSAGAEGDGFHMELWEELTRADDKIDFSAYED